VRCEHCLMKLTDKTEELNLCCTSCSFTDDSNAEDVSKRIDRLAFALKDLL